MIIPLVIMVGCNFQTRYFYNGRPFCCSPISIPINSTIFASFVVLVWFYHLNLLVTNSVVICFFDYIKSTRMFTPCHNPLFVQNTLNSKLKVLLRLGKNIKSINFLQSI
jgi:hypothetical protein